MFGLSIEHSPWGHGSFGFVTHIPGAGGHSSSLDARDRACHRMSLGPVASRIPAPAAMPGLSVTFSGPPTDGMARPIITAHLLGTRHRLSVKRAHQPRLPPAPTSNLEKAVGVADRAIWRCSYHPCNPPAAGSATSASLKARRYSVRETYRAGKRPGNMTASQGLRPQATIFPRTTGSHRPDRSIATRKNATGSAEI